MDEVGRRVDRQLAAFACHGLKDLKNASLMRRVDTKYLVRADYIAELLGALREYYSALQIGDARLFRYTTTYYDTPDMHLYHHHHGGRLNRYKVRTRLYHDTDSAFLEVKHKDSRGVTEKRRVAIDPHGEDWIVANLDFLRDCGVPVYSHLLPAQVGSYRRLALADERSGERVTVDLGLSYDRPTANDSPLQLRRLAIIEVKQGRLDRNSPTIRHLQRHGYRPTGFSKYCIGQCLIQPTLKMNRFKPTLRNVARLQGTDIEAIEHA